MSRTSIEYVCSMSQQVPHISFEKKKMHGKHAETANTAALKTFNLPFLHSSLVGLNLFEVKK